MYTGIGNLALFLGVIITVIGMFFLYTRILPKKFDGTFTNGWLQFLHDYFNFKKLYIEAVLKFIFTLATVLCVSGGIAVIIFSFLSLFGKFRFGFVYAVGGFGGTVIASLAFMIFGPIVIRLVYEGLMMFILLVKNVTEINNKTKNDNQ